MTIPKQCKMCRCFDFEDNMCQCITMYNIKIGKLGLFPSDKNIKNCPEYPKDFNVPLYDSIRVLCKKRGITISELERTLEFSAGSICKWNENEPSVRKVQKVAEYLGVPIEKLLE